MKEKSCYLSNWNWGGHATRHRWKSCKLPEALIQPENSNWTQHRDFATTCSCVTTEQC